MSFSLRSAHELRNPLSPIRSAVAVIQRLGTADAKLLKLSEIIDRQSKHMARLLDDLMDVLAHHPKSDRVAQGENSSVFRDFCGIGGVCPTDRGQEARPTGNLAP